MSSPQHAELARIATGLEGLVEGLGVLAGNRIATLVVELWALGEEWDLAMEGLVAIIDEQASELDARQEAA